MIVGSGPTAVVYNAAEAVSGSSNYTITIPGNGADFAGISLAEFLIPKKIQVTVASHSRSQL